MANTSDMRRFEAIRAAYRASGFCIVDGVLTELELTQLRSACDLLLQEKPDDGGGKFHDIGRGDSRRFLRHRHRDFPEIASVALGRTAGDLASAILGSPCFLFNEHFVVKSPQTGANFAWHQDGAYVGFDHKPYLTLWFALDDAGLANGCVFVLPRNLDEGEELTPHRWDEVGKEMIGYDGPESGIAAVVPAGSAVIFSSTTLHCSGANVTDRARRAYLCQYSPEPINDPTTGAPKHFATPLA